MGAPRPKNLIGMRLSIARHAADMLNLQFGDITRENDKSWGELALHIQAPWRMRKGVTILIGRNDRWNPVDEIEDWDSWYQSPHPNREDYFWLDFMGRRDEATKSFECDSDSVAVRSALETEVGDLTLEFDDGTLLEIFGCGTDDEFWRLLRPGDESEHYVIEHSTPRPNKRMESNG